MEGRVSLPSFREIISDGVPMPTTATHAPASAISPPPPALHTSTIEPTALQPSNPHRSTSAHQQYYQQEPPPHPYYQIQHQQYHNYQNYMPPPPSPPRPPKGLFEQQQGAYGGVPGIISAYDAQQSEEHHVNNVHIVAPITDPIMPPANTSSAAAADAHVQSSFMHSPPPPPRYKPYHMPTASPPTLQALSRNRHDSNGSTDSSSAAASRARHRQRNEPVPISPTHPTPYQQQQPAHPPLPPPVASPPPRQHQHQQSEPLIPDVDDEHTNSYDFDEIRSFHGDIPTVGGMTTAKIRTIHKLAERRRRKEMKELFDKLRRCLPIDKSIRLSKWEVLKKAIDVISGQGEPDGKPRIAGMSVHSHPPHQPHQHQQQHPGMM